MKKLLGILMVLLTVFIFSCEKQEDILFKKTVDPIVITTALVDTISAWPDANLLLHVDFNKFTENVNSMMNIHIIDKGTVTYYDAKFLMNEDTKGSIDLNCMMYHTLFLVKDTITIDINVVCKDTTYYASTKYYYAK